MSPVLKNSVLNAEFIQFVAFVVTGNAEDAIVDDKIYSSMIIKENKQTLLSSSEGRPVCA